MTEVRNIARQIQQLEIYLNNLVSALTRGELPVNLQPVTQIFDNAIGSLPPILNLPQNRFIELYNDLPNLFTAYAIDVTLSEDSYHRQSNEIIFHRFSRGNYWIIQTQFAPDKGWLVPNPTKSLSLERMTSLDASFERDIVSNTSHSNCILVTPALVQILPIVEPLTWKLIERGRITNTQIQSSAATNSAIDSLFQKLVSLNDRILQIEREAITSESIIDKQEQLQSIISKIIEQLVTKQKDLEALKSELAESRSHATQQEREITALKVQFSSIDKGKNSSAVNASEEREIISLKIELEKLKVEHQSYKRQQDKNNQKLETNIKLLVAQEITKLKSRQVDREIETIDAEIVIQELKPEPKNIPLPTEIAPELSSQMSPFARLYNTGKVEFLRSYMASTASLVKNNSQMIELVEDNIGLYWIVPFNSTTHYLVPKINFPDDDKYLEGLTLLFDGNNGTAKSILFKPAIVTVTKANMPKRWKLEQKGYLVLN
jgi:DNA repair exonuclease SbcCD ATPase subunit